jgi:hypothetical protein
MKKLFIATSLIGILLSCADLDIYNDGRVTMEEVFSSYPRARSFYSTLTVPDIGLTYDYSPLASYCDEAQDSYDGITTSVHNWYNNMTSSTYNPLTASSDSYNVFFELIRRTGVFLRNIQDPQISSFEINEDEKLGWIATTRVLRAYCYLQLIKRYGGVPVMDTPYEVDHDFSKDRRATFEECVDYILSECDLALATPEPQSMSTGFRWRVNHEERTAITRGFAYAVKSQAALYAASPLWFTPGSKYTWEKAAEVTKQALDQCLAHGYELYNVPVDAGIAQNPYAYYFIQRSDPDRSIDKETIYESNLQTNIWSLCGTPTTEGMIKAGACPSQELVDSYEMANGTFPILGYSDADHLDPIINPASGYNPANPYSGRDPRFYASIYYNGAPRTFGAGIDYPVNITIGWQNSLTSERVDDYIKLTTTSFASPFIIATIDAVDHSKASNITLSFEYKSNRACPSGSLLFLNSSFGLVAPTNYSLPAASEWTKVTFDVTKNFKSVPIAVIRFDIWTGADDGGGPYELCIKNQKMVVQNNTNLVETFVGGNCGISNKTTDVRYTRTGYYMRKFNHNQSGPSLLADGYMKLFRLGELYLNFSEAAYQAYGPDASVASTVGGPSLSARDAVNAVRARASMPPLDSGLGKDDFEKRYRNERRVELAFEEYRFFDVRRWKILNETDDFVTGMRITKNDDGSLSYQRIKLQSRGTNADKYLMYPISEDEVLKMQSYTGQSWQNPGW